MVTYRMDRINKEFLRTISEMLQTRIKKDNVKNAILTKVDASKDLSHAKIFYTVIETEHKDDIQKALDAVSGQLRSMLGKEMHLRTIPKLDFVFDDSEAKARAMEDLLDKVAALDAEKRPSEEN